MKDKKGLKIFLIIVVLVIVIFTIHRIRNYMIIKKINEKQEEIIKMGNYSYSIEGNSGIITEVYYKNGISKNIIKTKDTTMISWYDEKTNETITYSPQTMKASVGTGVPSIQMQTLSIGNDVIAALISKISLDEINGEKCYVIKCGEETTYISQEKGTILKRIGGKIVKNGIETKSVVEYKEWEFNELIDEEMSKPNLTEYEILDSAIGYDYQY